MGTMVAIERGAAPCPWSRDLQGLGSLATAETSFLPKLLPSQHEPVRRMNAPNQCRRRANAAAAHLTDTDTENTL